MTSIGVNASPVLTESLAESTMSSTHTVHGSILSRYHWVLTLFEVFGDGLTVFGAVFGSYAIYRRLHLGLQVRYSFSALWTVAIAIAALYVILLDREGAYCLGNSLLRIKETEKSLRVSAQAFLLILPVTFFTNIQLSRWVFVFALVLAPVLQIIEKQMMLTALQSLRSSGDGVKRAIIYGAGANGRRVFSALIRSPKVGLRPVAFVDDNPGLSGQEIFEYAYRRDQSLKVLPEPITVEVLKKHQCDFLILAIRNIAPARFAQIVELARTAEVRLAFISGQNLETDLLTEYADLDGIMLKVVGRQPKNWYYALAKRPFDLIGSLALIALTAPIWLMIAIAIRLDSKGPILFSQKRVGVKGRNFDVFKFRSMYVDAPKYGYSPKDSIDPRITRVGRFLRRTSLDELPQLLNVLRGEMSLVGPRPEMPFIVENYSALQRQRLQVTPGITGLWQLSADRSELIHENIQYDLYYIHHRNLFMDCAILIHTLLFAMRGV